MTKYTKRPIRFLEVHRVNDWRVKIYSISNRSEVVSKENLAYGKANIENWLKNSSLTNLKNYKIATLMLHEGKEGCFAILNWWIDESMIQQFIYLADKSNPSEFRIYSGTGIITCVWELSVIWFERNAWVEHVLLKSENPDFEAYLNSKLIQD
jgi:hypothetical protein